MAIAHRLGISQSAVSRILKRQADTASLSRRRGSGRRRCTSERTDKMIKRLAVVNPFTSASQIREELQELPIIPSIRTIRRRLLEKYGISSRKAAKKPLLSPKNVRDRIQFCKKYKAWTFDQWKNVLFSDESTFSQFHAITRRVWRQARQRYNKRFKIPVVKRAPTTMVWGAIAAAGTGPLWFMPPNTTINGQVYLNILQEKLPLYMPSLRCTTLQQDGAPCHKAKSVTKWLHDHNITLLGPWPGNSPDLNVIENWWNVVKNKVAQQRPKSAADLKEKIQRVWEESISSEYCMALVKSMPLRIAAVLRNGGYPTKYWQ